MVDVDLSNFFLRPGQRLMAGRRKLNAGLELRGNEDESAVDDATRQDFLGYGFWVAAGKVVKLRVAGKALGAV